MKYRDIIKFYENKDSRINKLDNLTDEQKEEVKAFFRKHNEQESKIDWNDTNALTYDNFKKVMDEFNNRKTWSNQDKIANKIGIEGLAEGTDYEYLGEYTTEELGTFRAYVPLSWLGAKTIAGKQVPPVNEDKDSAAWCIGYSKTDEYWNDYFINKQISFVIICGEDVPTKKICFEVKHPSYADINVVCWDYYDNDTDLLDFFLNFEKIESSEDKMIADVIRETYSYKLLVNLFDESVNLSYQRRELVRKDLIEKELAKEKAYKDFMQSLTVKEGFELNGYDFPFIQAGERPEGKVFMSKYLTNMKIPFSPSYRRTKYDYFYDFGCNRWDVSIVRQWLNSDALAGQWYKEYDVDGYKVDWDATPDYTKDFIKNTDGFLRLVGIAKSDLNPVTNITYTSDGSAIKTVDYVWIPSLSELNIDNNGLKLDEGNALDYWKKIPNDVFGEFGTYADAMALCNAKNLSGWYFCRSIPLGYGSDIYYANRPDMFGRTSAYNKEYVAVLMSLKN